MNAQDVMTNKVATIGADATVRDAAKLMEQHRVKRVPVLDAGRLVGIVSRADLVRQLAKS